MVNHSLIKLVLFMAAGVFVMNIHKLNLNDIRGYGRKKPLEKEDFIAYVDYGEGSLSESGKAKVKMDWLPEGVLKISLDPPFVDRIIVE